MSERSGEDPATTDDRPFSAADPGDEDAQQGAPPLDDDQDGVLDPHEDGGQAGQEPDEGPTAPPPLPQP